MVAIPDAALKAIPHGMDYYMIGAGWVATLHGQRLLHTRKSYAEVPASHVDFAADMLLLLSTIDHGGKWVVGWTDFNARSGEPARFIMAWLDADGDVRFTVDVEDPFIVMCVSSLQYVAQCEAAYWEFLEHDKAVGVTDGQRIKAALGQESADPDSVPDTMGHAF